jgi:hypothetical protein
LKNQVAFEQQACDNTSTSAKATEFFINCLRHVSGIFTSGAFAMAKINKPILEQISLPAFIALRKAGRAINRRTVGYEEFDTETRRSKIVRSVAFGELGSSMPAVKAAAVKSKDMRPPKHPAGFCEKFLGREIKCCV